MDLTKDLIIAVVMSGFLALLSFGLFSFKTKSKPSVVGKGLPIVKIVLLVVCIVMIVVLLRTYGGVFAEIEQ